jgi:phospholipid-binding lipoprotein MlaA
MVGLAVPGPAAAVDVDHDPWQRMNRGVFWFNDKLDVYFFKPVATAWDFVLPDVAQESIDRFFTNLRFPVDFVNNVLQGKPGDAGVTVGRFVINTTVGVGGLFDWATGWGVPAHPEDFGQTLGVWGVGNGPYLVLPVLGPSTVRDGVGLLVDAPTRVWPWFAPIYLSWSATGLQGVNTRSLLLEEIEAIKASALDYYVSVRNGYLQHRAAEVADRLDEGANSDEEPEDLYDTDF